MMPKRMKSVIALIALVSFLGAGCVGPFQLSRTLGTFNAKAGNKWEVELVFLGLFLVHAYAITSLIDLLILNPIYFWQAPNTGPMYSDDKTADLDLGDGRWAVLTFSEQDGVLRADLFERGRWIDSVRVTQRMNGELMAENSNGKVRYESRRGRDGIQQVTDEGGGVVFLYRPEQIGRRSADIRQQYPSSRAGMIAGLMHR